MILVNPKTLTHKKIPNLALAYIGTISNSKIIDFNTQPEQFGRLLKNKTDVLGISIQSRSLEEYKKISDLYRKKYPFSKIVSVSGIIDTECCYPFLKLKENYAFPQLFGDNLPFPKYELFDSFKIFKNNWQSGRWAYVIMTSLGCPQQCVYCSARNRPYRVRSIENCYKELKQAKEKYGIKSFQVLDDCFNFMPERVIKFCEKVKSLKLIWYCSNGLRADKFNEETAKALKDSGCRGVSFGIESIHEDVLKNIKKGVTFKNINKAVDIARKQFRFVNGFFIIGLPGSTYQKDLNSLHWALRKGINAHFSYYLPFDKFIPFDKDFYGESSSPVSEEYPKKMQRTIFNLTEFMRIETIESSKISRCLNTIKTIISHDILYLPFYLRIGVKNNYLL